MKHKSKNKQRGGVKIVLLASMKMDHLYSIVMNFLMFLSYYRYFNKLYIDIILHKCLKYFLYMYFFILLLQPVNEAQFLIIILFLILGQLLFPRLGILLFHLREYINHFNNLILTLAFKFLNSISVLVNSKLIWLPVNHHRF